MEQDPTAPRTSNRLIVKLDRERYALDEDLDREANAIAADIAGAEVERVSHSGRVLLNLSADVDATSLAEELSAAVAFCWLAAPYSSMASRLML